MESLRDKIAIVGIGETEYVRRSELGPKELIIEAVQKALDDAKISPKEVDGIVTEGTWVPRFCTHNELAYNIGTNIRHSGTIDGSGGGNIASLNLAAQAIATGEANVVLTYYTNGYGSAPGRLHGDLWAGQIDQKDAFERPYGLGYITYFSLLLQRYIHEYGLTTRQLGSIAVNQRRNALLNGKGQMKKPLSLEDYENSPMVADPLRLTDCSLVTDGATAWVMTSAERARDCPHKPVYATGFGYGLTPMLEADYGTQARKNYLHKPHVALSLDRALQMAGITRDDLDFAQIYDTSTILILIYLESLGFCKKGEGGAFAESGNISLEGSLPINTHGGHLSHSFLNMGSHMVETVRQLRGEAGACQIKDAKFGMLNGGSFYHDRVTILRSD